MFYFRIDKVRFLDNGGIKSGLGIFGHDFATVKLLSFITRSDQSVPEVDELMRSNDRGTKKAALEKLVSSALSAQVLTEIDRVQDNVPVYFGDTGLMLYEADQIPEAFTWTFVAVRPKRGAREIGSRADEILKDSKFNTFAGTLAGVLGTGMSLANPAYAAGIQVAKFVAESSARRLMKKNDRQLGAVSASFIRSEHYPRGIRERHNIQDMTGNMFMDYTIFGYERAIPVEH